MKNMNLREFYQACDSLIASGWTMPQIERLNHFRDRFKQNSEDLPDFNLGRRHLEFIRWMVQTGKLSEYAD